MSAYHHTNNFKITTLHYEGDTYLYFHGRDAIYIENRHEQDLDFITEQNHDDYPEVRDYIERNVLNNN